MLATPSFSFSSSPHNNTFRPPPLSPLSANIHGPRTMSASSTKPPHPEDQTETKENQPSAKPSTSRTPHKAPLPQPSALRLRRREAYLSKVADRRDEARFASRGDDILRSDFVASQRRYWEELARSAPTDADGDIDVDVERDATELPGGRQEDAQMLSQQEEEFLREEEGEVEALLENLPMGEEGNGEGEESEGLWSDDVDYDALFSEVLSREGSWRGGAVVDGGGGAEEKMDVS